MAEKMIFLALFLFYTAAADCGLGFVNDTYTNECVAVPRWSVRANETTTICYDQTWARDGPARHVASNYPTCVEVSYTNDKLNFKIDVFNDNVQQNKYLECNTDMYNQEVVELFITNDVVSPKPSRYYELEVTPVGAVWLGDDSNPGGERTNLTHKSLPCNSVGTDVSRAGHSGWKAEIEIPYSLIGKASQYRLNFFRVQMDDAWNRITATKDTVCDPSNCTFTCATCPTTAQPDFHHSGFFGFLSLL